MDAQGLAEITVGLIIAVIAIGAYLLITWWF
jgi:hypothetical protein